MTKIIKLHKTLIEKSDAISMLCFDIFLKTQVF